MRYTRWFRETGIHDVARLGGENASLDDTLCELTDFGIQVPDGFPITAEVHRTLLNYNRLEQLIKDLLDNLKRDDVNDLSERGSKIRSLIHGDHGPEEFTKEILETYHELSKRAGIPDAFVAVRFSATAEDLPNASFAGQQETYLMVRGDTEINAGRKVGICCQAHSDYPDFAAFLVEQGINSISLTPDSVLRTKQRVYSRQKERGA